MLINEVAKTLGISQDTIRYYEKVGIVSPRHNEKNGYREYEPEDIFCLMRCMRYRKMGLSIEEIVQAVNAPTVSPFLGSIGTQIHMIDSQMKQLNVLREYMKRYEQKIRTRVYNIGRMWVTWRPEMRWIKALQRDRNEYQIDQLTDLHLKWLGYMPFAEVIGISRVDQYMRENQGDIDIWGLGIEEKYVDSLCVPVNDTCLHVAEEMVLATVYDAGSTGYITGEAMKSILDNAVQLGYIPYGVITSNLLVQSWSKERSRCIFEVLVPIQQSEDI